MKEKLFNVGVKAVIRKDHKVLMMKNKAGFWEVPGGRIDANESIEQALHRELREELPNIHSIVLGEVLDARRLHKDIHDNVSLVLIFYEVSADFDGEPQISDEHTEWKWADPKDALDVVQEPYRPALQRIIGD